MNPGVDRQFLQLSETLPEIDDNDNDDDDNVNDKGTTGSTSTSNNNQPRFSKRK